MIQLFDCSPNDFLEFLNGKKLFLFGADNVDSHFYDVFCRGYHMEAA